MRRGRISPPLAPTRAEPARPDPEGAHAARASGKPGDSARRPSNFARAASASPNPVNGTTTNLSVLGADTLGESSLSYTWTATTVPAGAQAPGFSPNGTNAAKNDTVTFHHAGTYVFPATVTNLAGLSVTSSVTVTVNQTLSGVTVTPAMPNVLRATNQQFAARAQDQFGIDLYRRLGRSVPWLRGTAKEDKTS